VRPCHACLTAAQAAEQGGHTVPSYVCRGCVSSRDDAAAAAAAGAREGSAAAAWLVSRCRRVGVLGVGRVGAPQSSSSAASIVGKARGKRLRVCIYM
jgi:hypothetical protein